MSIFTKVWDWLSTVFVSTVKSAAHTATAITEALKVGLDSGIVGFVAKTIDAIAKTGLAEEIVADLQKWIPKILAAELAIEGIPANPTEQDILDFEKRVLTAFGVTDGKSKLYTVLAAQVYGIIKARVDQGTTVTFAQLVEDVEEAYIDYLSDKADSDNDQN